MKRRGAREARGVSEATRRLNSGGLPHADGVQGQHEVFVRTLFSKRASPMSQTSLLWSHCTHAASVLFQDT